MHLYYSISNCLTLSLGCLCRLAVDLSVNILPGPKLGISNLEFDQSLKEAKDILKQVKYDLEEVSKIGDKRYEIEDTHLVKANKALEGILKLKEPVDVQEQALLDLKDRIKVLDDKIADLKNYSINALKKAGELNHRTKKQR